VKHKPEDLYELSKTATVEELMKVVEYEVNHAQNWDKIAFINVLPTNVWRARKHNHPEGSLAKNNKLNLFLSEKEFWNPPAEFVSRDRCNDEKESLFYCANGLNTALLECRPSVGDYFTIANFKNYKNYLSNEQFIVHCIGRKYLSQVQWLSKLFKYAPESRKGSMNIDNFLDELFHQIVSEEDQHI
jgi:hypothetical protein